MTKEVAPAARQQSECTRAPNLLVGDSLVAREAGWFFSQLRPANSAQAFPGARVKKVTEEVAKLNLKTVRSYSPLEETTSSSKTEDVDPRSELLGILTG